MLFSASEIKAQIVAFMGPNSSCYLSSLLVRLTWLDRTARKLCKIWAKGVTMKTSPGLNRKVTLIRMILFSVILTHPDKDLGVEEPSLSGR